MFATVNLPPFREPTPYTWGAEESSLPSAPASHQERRGDLPHLARSAALLEMILRELRATGVELLTVKGAERHA
ncbi:MAG: hypothetical protein Kow00129_16970 [Thermoleophilia bacterium]